MSSFTRTIQRRIMRSNPDYESAPQPVRMNKDGGYSTLRPTKGWFDVAAVTIYAQHKLAQILSRDIPIVRVKRDRKNYSTFKPVTVVDVVTRQQRRYAERKAA